MAAPVVQWQPMPEFKDAREMHEFLDKATAGAVTIRNFFGVILSVDEVVVETPLFPRAALEFYTSFNLCRTDETRDAEAYEKYYTAARGGGQGDYRPMIQEKINNVVDCLTKFPGSKRAVLTIAPASLDHSVDQDAKCLRELHFRLERRGADAPVALHCTGFMRAQAAVIFPKNIHFIGTIMQEVARRLGVPTGTYTHFVTTMFGTRQD